MSFALSERAKILLKHHRDPSGPSHEAPKNIRLAVEAALDRGETHYTDRPGLLLLREKIAAILCDQFSIVIQPRTELIVTCGVTEARFLVIQQILSPGAVLAAPESSDVLFGAALLRGAELTNTIVANTRMVYLRSSTPEATLRAHLAITPDSALILFEVEATKSTFHPGQLEQFARRTITIGGLGEESWRIGYLASPGGPSANLQDFKQALTICSTNLSQWASLAALESL